MYYLIKFISDKEINSENSKTKINGLELFVIVIYKIFYLTHSPIIES